MELLKLAVETFNSTERNIQVPHHTQQTIAIYQAYHLVGALYEHHNDADGLEVLMLTFDCFLCK